MPRAVSEKLTALIEAFSQLPGVGPKTAEKYAFYVLKAQTREALGLAQAITDVKESMKVCTSCFALADRDPCSICSDPKRDHSVICVVEQPKDVWTVERAETYNGLYHVLMGRIAPLDGVGPEDLTLNELAARVKAGGVREVIVATNPDAEGDITAACVKERLASGGARVTRLARGIPTGATLEHASRQMLADALEGRRET